MNCYTTAKIQHSGANGGGFVGTPVNQAGQYINCYHDSSNNQLRNSYKTSGYSSSALLDGSLAYLLNTFAKSEGLNGWSRGKSGYPVHADSDNKEVYSVTFKHKNNTLATVYTNYQGKVDEEVFASLTQQVISLKDGIYSGWYHGSTLITASHEYNADAILNTGYLDVTISDIEEQVYSGAPITPEIHVNSEGAELQKDKDYTVSFQNNVNAGTATAIIQFTGKYTGTLTKDFTIKKKDLTVYVENATKYFGTANPQFKLRFEGFVPGENETVLQGKASLNCGATVDSLPGEYEITVSGFNSANYNIKYVNGILTVIQNQAPQNVFEANRVDKDWYQELVLTPQSGYAISLNSNGPFSTEPIRIVEDGKDKTVNIYTKNVATGERYAAVPFTYSKDSAPPVVLIKSGRYAWDSFSTTVKEVYFNNDVTIEITANDELSGVLSVAYYVSEDILPLDRVKGITNWNEGDSLSITDDGSFVLYAKAVDAAGNITYLNSELIVIDRTAPVINGITDGKSYMGEQSFTVSDANLASLTINGVQQNLNAKSYTLTKPGKYTIVAVDKAGNKTVSVITINGKVSPETGVNVFLGTAVIIALITLILICCSYRRRLSDAGN